MSDKLNNLLRQWSEERQSSDRHLGSLADQIRLEAVRQRTRYSGADASSVGFWQKLSFAGLGAAVALVAVLGILYGASGPDALIGCNGVARLIAVTDKDRQASSRLFYEMEKLFPESLAWVAESNGEVGMGVDSSAGGVSGNAQPMLVRLMVVARKDDASCWSTIWNADVMLRGEDVVEVVPNKESGNKLAFWVYPLSDGKIAIDSEVALNLPLPLSSRGSMVVKQGEANEIISISENGIEYKLLQVVTKLGAGCAGVNI